VTTAGTVAAATAAGLADMPDVLLLDLSLPDGHGLDIIERLRTAERLPRVAVALTGHDDESLAARCRAAGCRDVMLKPVPVRLLLGKLREWLEDRTPGA
jgi:CheY-like chemotaxis protein